MTTDAIANESNLNTQEEEVSVNTESSIKRSFRSAKGAVSLSIIVSFVVLCIVGLVAFPYYSVATMLAIVSWAFNGSDPQVIWDTLSLTFFWYIFALFAHDLFSGSLKLNTTITLTPIDAEGADPTEFERPRDAETHSGASN